MPLSILHPCMKGQSFQVPSVPPLRWRGSSRRDVDIAAVAVGWAGWPYVWRGCGGSGCVGNMPSQCGLRWQCVMCGWSAVAWGTLLRSARGVVGCVLMMWHELAVVLCASRG